MPELQHTKVYRGGVTAPYLTIETRECTFHANTKSSALDVRFNIASKGGGTTSILLQIGLADLPAILETIASTMPETAGVFSDCAAIANKKNLEQLAEARRVKDDEKARAQSLIDRLEGVEEFVSEKYYAAPVGEDEREAAVKNQLEEVIALLQSLS